METIKNVQNFKGAFACHKCPGNNDPSIGRACPAWMSTIQTDIVTQKQRTVEQCGWMSLQFWMEHIAQCANQAAASADKVHNGLETAFSQLPIAKIMIQDQESEEPVNGGDSSQARIEGPAGESKRS